MTTLRAEAAIGARSSGGAPDSGASIAVNDTSNTLPRPGPRLEPCTAPPCISTILNQRRGSRIHADALVADAQQRLLAVPLDGNDDVRRAAVAHGVGPQVRCHLHQPRFVRES